MEWHSSCREVVVHGTDGVDDGRTEDRQNSEQRRRPREGEWAESEMELLPLRVRIIAHTAVLSKISHGPYAPSDAIVSLSTH